CPIFLGRNGAQDTGCVRTSRTGSLSLGPFSLACPGSHPYLIVGLAGRSFLVADRQQSIAHGVGLLRLRSHSACAASTTPTSFRRPDLGYASHVALQATYKEPR